MRHLLINGRYNTFDDWGLVLSEKTLNPPAPKYYKVDVPGADGDINITQALTGNTAYENREQEFVFTMMYPTQSFEKLKTEISNAIHGQEFDYELSWDKGYTYHGWFTVDKYETDGILNRITVTVDADPYKSKGTVTKAFDVADGMTVFFDSGRKSVRPTFEFTADTILVHEGNRYVMPSGTYTINDLWFKQGMNKVTFVRGDIESHITHKEIMEKGLTHGDLGTKPVYEWFKGLPKYAVSRIVMRGTETPTSGVVTFTVTDEGGNVTTHTLDLGEFQIAANGDLVDTVTIYDGMARISKFVQMTDSETLEPYIEETGYAVPFPMPFSLEYPIASVTHDSAASVTYELSEENIERVFVEATHADYMEGGSFAMTHEEMGAYRIEQLAMYDTERSVVYEKDVEMVYVNYDWHDL